MLSMYTFAAVTLIVAAAVEYVIVGRRPPCPAPRIRRPALLIVSDVLVTVSAWPSATKIVSPAAAAVTASWIVESAYDGSDPSPSGPLELTNHAFPLMSGNG